ncbi:EF-hand domain-containing protein [Thioclava kandeliae]|uniref:EF-hand domain-containing protein n=1 Tax=Thioclava kandeliae TaxID=3070818 RepID=A0ABV1SEC4_9RHOB
MRKPVFLSRSLGPAIALGLSCTAAIAQAQDGAPPPDSPHDGPPPYWMLDHNHDGHVSIREFDDFFAHHPIQPRAPEDAPPPPRDPNAPPPKRDHEDKAPSGKMVDRNHDGRISPHEYDAFLKMMAPPPER